jgi:hypothetical protein
MHGKPHILLSAKHLSAKHLSAKQFKNSFQVGQFFLLVIWMTDVLIK